MQWSHHPTLKPPDPSLRPVPRRDSSDLSVLGFARPGDERPGPRPQRLAALRPGAAAATFDRRPRPPPVRPHASPGPQIFPLDRVFVRAVASRQGLARALQPSENAGYVA